MTTSVQLFFLAIILSILVACWDQRPRADDLSVEQGQQTERLLANAESGTAEDKYNLAMRFERGIVVRQNYREAVRWYRLSAMQAYPELNTNFASCRNKGEACPRTTKKRYVGVV